MPRRHIRAAGALALVSLIGTSVALAAGGQTYSQKFTTSHPRTASGMTFSAANTAEVPVQAKTVTLTFPAGTKIDTGALAKCSNPPACPTASKIGSGKANVGLAVDVTAYNRAGGMALIVSNPVGPAVILTPKLKGTKLTLQIPSLTFNGQTLVLSKLTLNIRKAGTAKRPYIRTPATCPAGGWQFTAAFVYVDRTKTTLTSTSACKKH